MRVSLTDVMGVAACNALANYALSVALVASLFKT
jgi:hypothetical protein